MSNNPNVLVVDDRPENLLSVEAVLERLDVTIFKASSADAALRFILSVDFAVILLDVEMPDIDGFETAKLIRSRERSRDVPIIFLTAIDRGDHAVQKAYELGAVDFLVKPLQPDVLRWKVSVFAELSRKAKQDKELLHEQIARAESEAAARRAGLLANASAALASSLSDDVMLGHLIRVLVPEFADCAALFRLHQGQELRLHDLYQDAACSTGTDAFDHHALQLSRNQDVMVHIFEGRLPLAMVNIAERPNWVEIDPVHADFFESSGLQFGMFLPVHGRETPLGVLALYRSARRPFSAADQKLAEDLVGRIALAVTNALLYEASQQAGRAKDRFLAVVSHELRTPLTAILGWVHILLSKKIAPEAVEGALQTIHRNAKLQSDLIGDILDFSRITTGQFPVEFQDVEIREVVRVCIETVRPIAEQKRIRLVYSEGVEAPTVAGDPTRLQQLFANLLANAVKFTPEGGIVEVILNATESHAEVQVKDTGVGIDPEFISQVFDPFMQADSSTTRSHPGLGLGLAIVRHLVEIHGGAIAVTSPGRDQGSTFTVRLPVRHDQALAS